MGALPYVRKLSRHIRRTDVLLLRERRQKRVKRLTAIALCAVILLSLCFVPVVACSDSDVLNADILFTLGLIEGKNGGYALDDVPTRTEAAVMAVRLSGLAGEALSDVKTHPFLDVAPWADGYVSCAWEHGIAVGVSDTAFGADLPITMRDYAVLMLRTLGYSEGSGDFEYSNAVALACRLGLCDGDDGVFTRSDMFNMSIKTLSAGIKSDESTLIKRLCDIGAVDDHVANAVGYGRRSKISAETAAERYSACVFKISCYESDDDFIEGVLLSEASGFFISGDGIAVTNAHSIDKCEYATATLENGEVYPIESVVYADDDIDIAAIRIGNVTLDGKTTANAFPYLKMLSADTIKKGAVVYNIGNPLGLVGTITTGVVSYTARSVDGFALPMIQNTAPISMGSSGGALLNEYGEVVGVTCAYYIYGQSLYLAVPLDPIIGCDLSGDGISILEYNASKASAEGSENG